GLQFEVTVPRRLRPAGAGRQGWPRSGSERWCDDRIHGGYQMDARRWRPGTLGFAPVAAAGCVAGSRICRVKASNCAAISELPVNASGTPELSAVDTVL